MLHTPVLLSSEHGRHEEYYRSKQLLQTQHVLLRPASTPNQNIRKNASKSFQNRSKNFELNLQVYMILSQISKSKSRFFSL